MTVDEIPIARPLLGEEEKQAVLAVLESGQLAQARVVAELEAHFAEWCGVTRAVAVSSGTTSLHLALLASAESGHPIHLAQAGRDTGPAPR